ncbi:MAG TPA: hypothetical protein VJC08_02020 [bacterium]|nr:hypothetical protein [bacterium]
MTKSKKWIVFLVLLGLLGAKAPVLRAEDPQIPEAASDTDQYGTLVLPPQNEDISPSPSPSPESSDAPAEMGAPVSEDEEEEEVKSKLSFDS